MISTGSTDRRFRAWVGALPVRPRMAQNGMFGAGVRQRARGLVHSHLGIGLRKSFADRRLRAERCFCSRTKAVPATGPNMRHEACTVSRSR